MSPTALLLGLCGVAVAGGVVVTIAAFFWVPDQQLRARRPSTMWRTRLTRLHAAAIAAGVVTLVVTRWPVAAIGAGLAVWFVPSALGGGKASERQIARTEAIASWTRRLADLLGSGAVGSLDGALRRSAASCPAPIAPEVRALVARIGPQGMERALRAFADEMDDLAAEKVAAALILRSRHGGRGLAAVLAGLASDLEEQARNLREVEAERAKPRSNSRTNVILMLGLVVGMILFARPFLEPYSTVFGQIALGVVVLIFGIALRWLKKRSQPVRSARFLTDPRPERAAA